MRPQCPRRTQKHHGGGSSLRSCILKEVKTKYVALRRWRLNMAHYSSFPQTQERRWLEWSRHTAIQRHTSNVTEHRTCSGIAWYKLLVYCYLYQIQSCVAHTWYMLRFMCYRSVMYRMQLMHCCGSYVLICAQLLCDIHFIQLCTVHIYIYRIYRIYIYIHNNICVYMKL